MFLRQSVLVVFGMAGVIAGCAGVRGQAPAAGQAAVNSPFLTRQGARLFLNGREYRAIGVNVPHLHQAYFGTWFHIKQIYGTPEKAREAIVAAIEDAETSGIAFIRFFAHPGYPRDVDMLYAKDPQEYWRRMDELFALCRQHHVKLVPSLGTITGWHLYCGETTQAILDPNSKTAQATLRYVREFVSRYKDDPTVLMWELENEPMLKADVDMKGRNLLPKGVYPPGAVVREKGVREDSLNWDMLLKIYKEHAAFIKALDPNHLVTSGDAHVRPECTSRRETFPDFKYRNDTLQEFLANNLAAQPEPLDVYSFHQYGTFAPPAKPDERWGLTSIELFRRMDRAVLDTPARRSATVREGAGRPLFIGELGQSNPSFKDDPESKWMRAYIDVIEQEGVSLAALWVWHFPWQPDLTVSSATHPLLVQRVAAFNQKYAGQ